MNFCGKQYLKNFKCERNAQYWSECPLTIHFLKHLQAVDLSFVTITKPLSNKIGEPFFKGLK